MPALELNDKKDTLNDSLVFSFIISGSQTPNSTGIEHNCIDTVIYNVFTSKKFANLIIR